MICPDNTTEIPAWINKSMDYVQKKTGLESSTIEVYSKRLIDDADLK
jgi:hypothetical protein